MLVTILLVVLVVSLGELLKAGLPALVKVEAFLEGHRALLLTGPITATVVGCIALIRAWISLLMHGGRSMQHEEVEDLERRRRDMDAQPYVARKSVYRVYGSAVGIAAEDSFSLLALKPAWRARAWRHSSLWRMRFLAVGGAFLVTYGLAFASVALPLALGIRMSIVGLMLYVSIRLWGAMRSRAAPLQDNRL